MENVILTKSKDEIIDYVIDQYGEQIKRVIFTYVKSYTQTDDLFQEFLINVYQRLEQFEANSSLKTWLYRIAINKCKDYLRSPIHRLFKYNEEVKSIHVAKSAEQLAMENEQEMIIVEAILSLPTKYREIFVLRFYQSFSVRQVSDALRINESTLKTRIMRGKKKLQQKLGGEYLEQYE
ncbi:sigma-70 family RNA polymerase sigma factor [Aquibacillus halophilus]|uniref:Sigma-70 family RNA polymerase sigma factor n=1 Tax=Aquibacillus halophilus TaxID=930132 RepID=A0A6A8D7C8_9BACI|nr:sigma-70 family RNA polymerase sigma factor [Aquibacillus halophilus]MRH41498.1 sigma-70 family RNA polymerase sigma factor [Aquibacillus halophilus]